MRKISSLVARTGAGRIPSGVQGARPRITASRGEMAAYRSIA